MVEPTVTGERYLRLLLEQLIGDGAPGFAATLGLAASAVVAAGGIDPGVAADLVDDATLAEQLRSVGWHPAETARRRPPDGPAPGRAPTPRAVAVGPAAFPAGDGSLVVDAVTFGADGASIAALGAHRDDPAGAAARPRAARHAGAAASRPTAPPPPRPGRADAAPGARGTDRSADALRHHLVVTDPGGTAHRPVWSRPAGAVRGRWSGRLEPGIDGAPAWLDVALPGEATHRLVVSPPSTAVRGRSHGRSPGASWLLASIHHRIARLVAGPGAPGGTPPGGPLGPAVDALVAVGAVGRADPVVRQAALVDALDAEGGADDLDDSLASSLARRLLRPGGWSRTWPIATLVDLGDGSADLEALAEDGDGLRVTGRFHPWSPAGALGEPTWAMSAFDDRDHHYVGVGRPGTDGGDDVEWWLYPALDPEARSLRLTIARPATEASVEIVLR